jgi:hypothetical protein
VAYDAPCHLQPAQRVHAQPLAVLRSIPGLRLHLLPGSDRCCGAAGIYASLHPEMSRAVLADKTRSFTDAPVVPDVVTTGNGIFRVQDFVTPQYGVTRPYSYGSPTEFELPAPHNSDPVHDPDGYRRQADEVLQTP